MPMPAIRIGIEENKRGAGGATDQACGRDSQKAANLARDDRVSLTIDHDTPQVMEITSLSMAAHAQPVLDREEASKVLHMLPLKYPEQVNLPVPMPTPEDIRIAPVCSRSYAAACADEFSYQKLGSEDYF
jgi:hypothetical protein